MPREIMMMTAEINDGDGPYWLWGVWQPDGEWNKLLFGSDQRGLSYDTQDAAWLAGRDAVEEYATEQAPEPISITLEGE